MEIIASTFEYAFIMKRSRLGLLAVIFRLFVTELWPLIDVRISFPVNIFRTNEQNFIKICICIDIDKIYIRIVIRIIFRKFVKE